MDIKEYVYAKIAPIAAECGYRTDTLFQGLDAYITDNGFFELIGMVDDEIISSVIDNNLAVYLTMPPRYTLIYFSNYLLIEQFRIACNRIHKCAEKRLRQISLPEPELKIASEEYNRLLQKICACPELYSFLDTWVSESLLDLDYANGITVCMSRRLAGKGGKL